MDPNEILREIRERKEREVSDQAAKESAERASSDAERAAAEGEKMDTLDRGGIITEKLDEIREILDRQAKKLQGFASQSQREDRLLNGEVSVQEAYLTVAKDPPGLTVALGANVVPDKFTLIASGIGEEGPVHFSFYHQGASTFVASYAAEQINETDIEELFIDFVKWFGEKAS
jgi:hypothetical protein